MNNNISPIPSDISQFTSNILDEIQLLDNSQITSNILDEMIILDSSKVISPVLEDLFASTGADSRLLIRRKVLNEKFLIKYKDMLDWNQVITYQNVPERLLRQMQFKITHLTDSITRPKIVQPPQNISQKFADDFNLTLVYEFVVHNYGSGNDVIYRTKADPNFAVIDGINLTKAEALEYTRLNNPHYSDVDKIEKLFSSTEDEIWNY